MLGLFFAGGGEHMTRKDRQRLKLVNSSPKQAAKTSGLRYVTDAIRGITRRGKAKKFRYYGVGGKRLRRPGELRRITSMAIPPAWQHVWISPFPDSHLQATGRDARNRKQYRYHSRWRNLRDQTKYDRMILVGGILPKLRARVAKDLAVPGLPRAKVIATVVKLLETTLIRIGNSEYARENNSFGLTTLRNRHVEVRGSKIRFRFHGKSGIDHEVDFSDKKLAQIVRRCQELPGQEIFQYFDADGKPSGINSSDINDYLREATGFDLTAKDFRTWAGTVLALRAFGNIEQATSKTQAKRNIVQAVEIVARQLGNTRTVCQKCYIHPAIVNAYLDGSLVKVLARQSRRARTGLPQSLTPAESAVMAILNQTHVTEPNQKVA